MDWELKQFDDLTTRELYTILQARNAIFVVEQECAYHEIDGHDPDCWHLSLKIDGELAAYSRLLEKGVKYDIASIGRIIVPEKFRGRGLARQLVQHSIDIMTEEWGEREIKLQAQTYLRDFYESFGFKATSEEYLDDGIPHVDMLMKVEETSEVK
ncbi:GNAT family N-acetyltransferase [Jeotgalibacillus sp. R-1-5s-1]|uniref:GNAT family N-acetyltransferase n=1 Tax=Jeotgalibacillus sp. R-1-5s-1 TaxID=2555897 RepID=UPI00106CF067|nr:GNAT family N-acetyltransferase [Jeotgalibacillus sp. R-1-5s-1]TFE02497.1 GNAT family N-acetyltransferase [Jeotgalibacillus sp. R-1-5s-1]